MVKSKKDELHEDVVVSLETQTNEYEKLMQKATKETLE